MLKKIVCEMCGNLVGKVWYDAKIGDGGWAKLCHECYKDYGTGLGMGKGQKFDTATGKKLEG